MMHAAIFDLDGVIVNTVPLHFKAWQRMFKEYGKDFSFEDYKQKVDGIPRIDGARAILRDLDRDGLQRAGDKKQGYFLEYLYKEDIPVYAGTVSLIKDFKKEGLKVAVISSSKNCLPILKKTNLADLFNVIITGNDITKGKPDPQAFFMAADKMSAGPEGCVVFEDAVLGVEAAKRAGMRCVGIDRYGKPERLNKADLPEQILISGGLAREPAIATGLAALLDRPVRLLDEPEATLLGTARLAGGLSPYAEPGFETITAGASGRYLVEKFARWQAWCATIYGSID